ncbi:MAG: efflux RND transporter permease subunit, partial [Victivallales bacterium]|nr:efflux RND transporter permease subunit [Victivallales bacterium]
MINRIIEWSLKFPGLVALLFAVVVGWGIYEYRTMPVDAFPDISPVMVPIFADADGMAPEEIERLITYPLESGMNGLPGVTQVKSTSAFGMAVIYVYFKESMDIYFCRQLVAERLADARGDLPEGMEPPTLGPISSGLGQIFLYYLTIDDTVDTEGKPRDVYLRELNDWVVKYQLQTVPGVTDILSIGGHVLQYEIRVDPEALRRYGLTMGDIGEAVSANNRNVGGQYLLLGSEEHLVRGIGLVEGLDDLRRIPIKESDGRWVTMQDVGEVDFGKEIRRGVVSQNGEREVVSGMVLKLFGANTSVVTKRLYEKVESVQAGLPEGVELIPYYEQAELVAKATGTVKKALLQGSALVAIVLLLFLGNVRAALLVSVALPFCTLVAVLGMRFLGVSANLMSLGGIAVGIGMLVDGAIVVVENSHRLLNLPENRERSRQDVILQACREVGRPIVFAIAIVIV